ncbi:hypothetical protein EYV94_18715 [Puteibacter caeruleilacunae]|nr:hypothetical protein EYV94_18715 [Puteibacter caeruleilacunae]
MSKLSVVLISVTVFLWSCGRIKKEDRVYVKGEIVKIFYSGGGACRVKFKDKSGVEHTSYNVESIEKLRHGEMYYTAYNKNDLDEVNVYFTAPIIRDSADYVEGKGYVRWNLLKKFDNSNHVRFIYSYSGREYMRYQKLVDKSVRKGDKVDILINRHNPKIAYVIKNCKITH